MATGSSMTVASINLLPGSLFNHAGQVPSLAVFGTVRGHLNYQGGTWASTTTLEEVSETGRLTITSGNFDKQISRMAGFMNVLSGASGPGGLVTTLSGRLLFAGNTASGGIINMFGRIEISAGTFQSSITNVSANASIVLSSGTFNGQVTSLSGLLQNSGGTWSGTTVAMTSSAQIYGTAGIWSGAICSGAVMPGRS